MPTRDAASLALLLESTGEGIYGIDRDGRCTFINRAAAQMLGYRTEQVLGQNMHRLVHHTHADGRDYPEHDCPILNAYRQGLPCRIDHEVFWRADGRPFDAEYSSYPVIEAGEVGGAVITFVDITERKRAERALQQAKQALERTNDELEHRVAERTHALSDALTRLRELSAWLETVRESERTRIAREIHDELGSLLVALKMDVNWIGRRVDDRPPLAAKCAGMGRLIDTAVDKVGRIITDLRPSILDHQGLWAALEWQAQEFIDRFEWQADLRVVVAAGVLPPQGGQAIAVFRIFQEMLSNVARHAQATRVAIRITVDSPPDPVLWVEVQDDGVGATVAALEAPRSYGVMGMRERAGHHGGVLTFRSAPGAGTCVRLVMPLHDEAPHDAAVPEAPPP
ncbi:PAS domain-containing sensor histidine kinase [Ideonella sp. A 288]|uniref:sensor histidine kinase n=1 Tax=Ideonella sp. A 288 TaxID=1962181 RepID=UPI001F3B3950|nr:PAS domain-containing sensor histidine kinase [Ideonella sp. A 288]